MEYFQDDALATVCPLIVDDTRARTVVCAGVKAGLRGGRLELGRGLASDSNKLARLQPAGPTAIAAYYRRAALAHIGGWPTAVGSEFADLDAAMSLARLGYKNALARDSQVVLRSRVKVRESAFARSRNAERFFLRHRFSVLSNLAHPLAAVGDCLAAGGPISIAGAVAGKIAAAFDVTACRQHSVWLLEQHHLAGKVGEDPDQRPPRTPDQPRRRAA